MTRPDRNKRLTLPSADDELIPLKKAAGLLGISLMTVERRLRNAPETLPTVQRLGWQRFVKHADLQRFLHGDMAAVGFVSTEHRLAAMAIVAGVPSPPKELSK